MKRNEMREAVWSQTDLDADDLPAAKLDLFLREAFQRTVAVKRRWPTYESEWSTTSSPTDSFVTLDSTIAEIDSVRDSATNRRLQYLDQSYAEESLARFTGTPWGFSVWASKLYLWPGPGATEFNHKIRGWRRGTYDWLTDPGVECDIDERLHLPICHFATALAYAQQEDTELESDYMARWQFSVNELADDVLRPSVYRPIVLNGGV